MFPLVGARSRMLAGERRSSLRGELRPGSHHTTSHDSGSPYCVCTYRNQPMLYCVLRGIHCPVTRTQDYLPGLLRYGLGAQLYTRPAQLPHARPLGEGERWGCSGQAVGRVGSLSALEQYIRRLTVPACGPELGTAHLPVAQHSTPTMGHGSCVCKSIHLSADVRLLKGGRMNAPQSSPTLVWRRRSSLAASTLR